MAIRTLLRYGGYKPSGRGRPASEFLLKAWPLPSIHPVVDFFNKVSAESGFPISVLDAEKLQGATEFREGTAQESYVFNASGQELKLEGLLVVCDQVGPAGSPVKDSQRTKVSDDTREFFVVVWGTSELAPRLREVGARIEDWSYRIGSSLFRV
ncbi:MAG: phenylalanine--tRNA ligase beta subunit-related protein [Vulcanimicrobiota bacterium]